MGQPSNNHVYVNQTAYEYTSTRSLFTLVAGPVRMVVTFTSNITPDDTLRSSLPYTYMNVDVTSADSSSHAVQLYTDISAEWVSGDSSATAQWTYGDIPLGAVPKSFGPAASANPTAQASTTYGTQTAFNVPKVVPHTMSPIYAQGQGMKPTPVANKAQPTYSPLPVEASTAAAGGIAYHKVFRQEQLEFSQTNEQADWGNW